jgi:hypothetical protein
MNECYQCGQDDRPFNYGRTNKGECSCKWYDKDITEISCLQCIENEIKAKKEQEENEIKAKKEQEENEIKAKKEQEDDRKNHDYMLFLAKWNGKGVKGKLSCYGIKKLQKLAK